MAHKKAAGSTKNGRDSNPRYLGIKIPDGGIANIGSVLVRQKGRNVVAGENVSTGKDHTLYATAKGKVNFQNIRKMLFNGRIALRKKVNVV